MLRFVNEWIGVGTEVYSRLAYPDLSGPSRSFNEMRKEDF